MSLVGKAGLLSTLLGSKGKQCIIVSTPLPTMAKQIVLSDKVQLASRINSLLLKYRNKILEHKQVIPWAGSKVGPCYAVSQDQLVGGFEDLQTELFNLLRQYEITSTANTIDF